MKLKAKAYLRIAAEDWRNKYDYVGFFIDGLAEVRREGRHGFVDKTGKEVIPLKYDDVWHFTEGLVAVMLGNQGYRKDKWGFVDETGKEVVPPKYDWVEPFDYGEAFVEVEGLAEVELGDKKGWVTKEGKELLITKDKYIQIKNLIELEKITEEDLINWINERAV